MKKIKQETLTSNIIHKSHIVVHHLFTGQAVAIVSSACHVIYVVSVVIRRDGIPLFEDCHL